MEKTCPNCNVIFETVYPDKIYCSKRCSKRARDKRSREHVREQRILPQKQCPVCGEIFEAIGKRRYCTERCARRAERKNPARRAKEKERRAKARKTDEGRRKNALRERKRRARFRKPECKSCGGYMPLQFGRNAHKICDSCRAKKEKQNKNCVVCGKELVKHEKKYCRSCAKTASMEKTREYVKRYFKTPKGKEILRKQAAKYFKTPKGLEIARRAVHRRMAKMKQLPYDLTADDWKKAVEYFGGKCAYCGERKDLQQEHFVPVSLGGGYTKKNIVPACKSCNCSKHDSPPLDWLRARENGLSTYRTITLYLESV